MKLFLLLTLLISLYLNVEAQIQQPAIKKIISTQPPAPTYTPAYTLTSVRVKIRTGNDNKEFPSKIQVFLKSRSTPDFYIYMLTEFNTEMKINSITDLGLEKRALGSRGPYESWFTLESIQKNGLELMISYEPNLFTDAWKIENITLSLEFKDQKGNLHPSYGSKTISFSTASGFLDTFKRFFYCRADGAFMPQTTFIQ